MRIARTWIWCLLAASLGGLATLADAPEARPPAKASALSCGGGGTRRSAELTLPQRGGGTLAARAFAPDAERQQAPCPLVVLLPGGGAGIDSVQWAAERLADDGYVAVVVKPERGGSTDSYHLAALSAIDGMLAAEAPWRASVAAEAVGVAGWSLGARSLTRSQAEDPRIKALVAWDNLALRPQGDEGSPACRFSPGATYPPRVPAMGQASDSCDDGRGAEAKKTAYQAWRDAGLPAMQLVFAGSTHFWWGAQGEADGHHDLVYAYTLAWFDRWLKDDAGATARLLERRAAGRPLEALLSSRFRSAAYLDGFDCPDLRLGCGGVATATSPASTATSAPTPAPTANAVILHLPAALRAGSAGVTASLSLTTPTAPPAPPP